MPARTLRVGLTVKTELPSKDEAVKRVLSVLKKSRVTVYADERCGAQAGCEPLDIKRSPINALVVIGGDGTIFRAIRELGGRSVPIIGVNRGGVGFLAEVGLDEVETVMPELLAGNGMRDSRQLLSILVERDGQTVFKGMAVNEAAIAQGAIARLLDLTTTVQGELLTTYRSDGLIIATPTGSTAYSLSAGGPIVHPRLDALIVTPLNAHTFSQKPIVIPGNQTVAIEVLPKKTAYIDNAVSLTLDGQVYFALRRKDIIVARVSRQKAVFMRRTDDTFLATLRKKLKWGERPG